MILEIESSGMVAGGMLPTADPGESLAFPKETEAVPLQALAAQLIDESTAAALQLTCNAFFVAQDEEVASRLKQGRLLLEAQAQLAKYGSGTFTAVLLAPRPEGFGFKSTTSAYDLMAEAAGKPKRSHKGKGEEGDTRPPEGSNESPALPPNSGVAPVPSEQVAKAGANDWPPGRSNESAPLPLALAESLVLGEQVEVAVDLPDTLDTSHTSVYAPLPFKGVYIPKMHVVDFNAWLGQFSSTTFSVQWFAWFQAAQLSEQEGTNAGNSIIQ